MTLHSIVRESKDSQKKYDVVINMQSCSGADISSYDDSVKDVLGCQRFSEICSIVQAKAWLVCQCYWILQLPGISQDHLLYLVCWMPEISVAVYVIRTFTQ